MKELRASLQEQLAYLTRVVNPNYIILIKNKANEDMDFSKLRPSKEEPKPEKQEVELRYSITATPKAIPNLGGEIEDKVFIMVYDKFFMKSVFECTANIEKQETIVKELKKRYKGSSIEDKLPT